jgi:uncharacterized protein (DUF362 family)/Pyruvate/2-oxoacid:ferredoxin oxidoreductase delta subunit
MRVLVRKVESLPVAVDEALDFLGYDFTGRRVWVKPNLLGPYRPEAGVTTDPELIRAVVRGLRHRGASVFVHDNPGGSLTRNVESYLAATGVIGASEGAFRISTDKPYVLALKSRFVPDVPVTHLITEADVILNLPVLKTHALTLLTGSVKNLFGLIPGGHKSHLHRVCPDPADFAELLVDIYQALPMPVLSIMDALRGMDGVNGPSGGRVLAVGKLLAGANPVAVDSVMAWMAGTDPERVPMLRIAGERRLGPTVRTEIEIVGEFAAIAGFTLPSLRLARFASSVFSAAYYRLMRHPPVLARNRCIRCSRCAQSCPAEAIAMLPFPRIDRRKCISCYCCAELCPEHAFSVPSPLRSLGLNLTGR